MKKFLILSSITFALILFGCKEEPSEVIQELQVDAVVEQMAGFGWEANQYVQTGIEVESVTQESDILEGSDIDISGGGSEMREKAITLFEEAKNQLMKSEGLFKSTSDSLYFYDDRIPGLLKVGYYNSLTDIARYYEVRTRFPFRPNMEYDSVQVIFIANGTLFNPFDDTLQSVHQTLNFKDYYFVQSIIGDLIITDYTPTEITGAELTQDTYYHQRRHLSHVRRFADFNPDKSGTWREDFDYKDGKTAYHQFTYNGDYTGSFEKQFRSGKNVSGTFDMIEDDLHGAWTELVQFPSGRYLDKIEREAEAEILLPDSTFIASLFEAIYFSSGRVDSSSMDITVTDSDSVKTTVLDIVKKNGANGTLTIKEYSEQTDITGTWTTWDGHYIVLSAELYIDGSGHVHYEVWSSYASYNNGDDPILIVDYYFSPDSEGNGTLSYDDKTYDITADENGKGTISRGGKSKQFNLIQ